MQTKELLRLTVATLVALAILLGLGVWQLQRLGWKDGLIAQIEARSKAPSISLEEAIAVAREDRDPSYYRVRAEGRFHHARELHLYAQALNGEPGWHVITPLQTPEGDIVLVDRGFVPDRLKEPSSRGLGQTEEVLTVTGIARLPDRQNLLTPDNEPEANRWFWRDLAGMAHAMFPSGTVDVAPFYLEAEASRVPGGWPEGGQTRLTLPNNHLQYAITWFLLAACLLFVYVFYVRSRYTGRA